MTTTPGSSTLKERIAALQQRSTSPQLSSPPRKVASGVSIPKNALRDKIARFEDKGAKAIGIGKPVARAGEQWDVRIKSLGNTPLDSRIPPDQVHHVRRLGYGRSVSETHEVSRDSASSPTSSHGDAFSEMYDEDSRSLSSSVLHSPSSSLFRELKGVTPSKSDDDDSGIHAATTATPLITVNDSTGPLIDDLKASNLEGQNVVKSPQSDTDPDKSLLVTIDHGDHGHGDDRNKDENQSVAPFRSNRPPNLVLQVQGNEGPPAESPTIARGLSESSISVPASVDDSANQVFPILDAFPTVPGHIPSSPSSRSTTFAPSQQAVMNLPASNHKSISNIHSIPSSAPSSTASSCSPTITIPNNNTQTPSPVVPRPSQGRKSQPRPKSSVPFWYDDDSDDGEPGWVSIAVTTRRY